MIVNCSTTPKNVKKSKITTWSMMALNIPKSLIYTIHIQMNLLYTGLWNRLDFTRNHPGMPLCFQLQRIYKNCGDATASALVSRCFFL